MKTKILLENLRNSSSSPTFKEGRKKFKALTEMKTYSTLNMKTKSKTELISYITKTWNEQNAKV
jgi:hypothetical protein